MAADAWRRQLQAQRAAALAEVTRRFGDLALQAEDVITLAEQGRKHAAEAVAMTVAVDAQGLGLGRESGQLLKSLGLLGLT